jgi:type IV secretion system protein TrbL
MRSRRSHLLLGLLVVLAAALATVAQPEPPKAEANIVCDAVGGAGGAISGGIEAVGAAVGGANPIGDACDAVTGKAVGAITSPVTGAIEGIGHGIFDQITTWVSEGASWLIEQVVSEIEKTTTPKLTTEGFLAEYGQMSEIAAVLAAAMVLLAILEAVAQGSWGMLARTVLVSMPVAFIGTSVAFVLVQMLLVATDGMCHGIAAATHEHSQHFFKSAIAGLAKTGASAGAAGGAGATGGKAAGAVGGAVAVPLFVSFLVAIIGAFAAMFVWIELVARDASVYVVSLFMPMALAASIWPRWSGALRRTGELLVVIISSKFVIVSVVALAAGLLAEKEQGVEHLLAASALMLLACFAPFMLLKLVPFAEGAMASAYGRRSASGASLSGMQLAYEANMVSNMARSNWGGASPPDVWNVAGGGGGSAGGGGDSPSSPSGGGGGSTGGGSGAGGAGRGVAGAVGGSEAAGGGAAAAGAAAPPAAPASVPLAAAKSARSAAGQVAQSGVVQAAGGASPQPGKETPSQPQPPTAAPGSESGADSSERPPSGPGERPPRPPQELSAKDSGKGSK